MKLTYYAGELPNFGDELNPYIWERILPEGFLDDEEKELFVGIGSILWDYFPSSAVKHVLGSGYGGYTSKPDVHDGSWNIVFVRGRRTAEHLGLPPEKAICDGAIILGAMALPESRLVRGAAFMPHFQSLERGFWAEACELAGVRLIDPTNPVEKVIAEIRQTSVLITEAMHGAIVADALRVPWVAARPIQKTHHMKWLDWSESLDLDLRFRSLWPTSVREVGGARNPFSPSWRAKRLDSVGGLLRPIDAMLTYSAAKRLDALTRVEPQLSRDFQLSLQRGRVLEATDAFVRSVGAPGLRV